MEDKKRLQDDVLYVQDIGFTVNIQVPCGGNRSNENEIFPVQVSSMELVQEIHQLLMDREDSCHRTCFSLYLDGVGILDNFAELKNIDGLKEGSILRVVEDNYTVREARIHLRHVRDLLKSIEDVDAFCGLECSSLSYLSATCADLSANAVPTGAFGEKSQRRKEGGVGIDCTPPDYILPSCPERLLNPLHPGQGANKGKLTCLKVLTTSAWNPPPGFRRLHGDLCVHMCCDFGG